MIEKKQNIFISVCLYGCETRVSWLL